MKRDINFFSAYQGKKQDIKEKQNNLVMYVVVGLVLTFVIGSFLYFQVSLYINERKITKVEEKMADPEHQKQLAISQDLNSKISSVNQYISQVDTITKSVESRKVVTPEILDDIQDAVPDEIIFTNYTISNTLITINGKSPNLNSVAQMQHNFRNLERVQDTYVSTVAEDGTFNIKIMIKDVE